MPLERKIAILRGINVGGKRKLLMADLKAMFKSLGYTQIQTYIQSGNVIFTTKGDDSNSSIAQILEESIKKKFDYEVPVIVRSVAELEKSASNNPFYAPDTDTTKLHLTFLKEEPAMHTLRDLDGLNTGSDAFEVKGNDVYFYCEGKYHQTKFNNNFFEKKLKVGATTRNWKTVLKLVALGKEE